MPVGCHLIDVIPGLKVEDPTADMSDPLSRGYWEDFLAFLGGIARGLTTLIFEGWLPPGQWFRRELRRLKTRIVNNDAIIAVTRIAQPNAPYRLLKNLPIPPKTSDPYSISSSCYAASAGEKSFIMPQIKQPSSRATAVTATLRDLPCCIMR